MTADSGFMGSRRDHGPLQALRRGAGRYLRDPKYWILAATTLIILYLGLVPLVFLVFETFTNDAGAWTLENVRAVAQDPFLGEMLVTSAMFTLGATTVAMTIGTILAYLHARTDIAHKPLIFTVSLVPVFIPGLLFALSWVQLASPRSGILNLWLDGLFGVTPFNAYSIWTMIWVEGANLIPVVFLLMLAGFRSMDPSLEEAAQVSGASRAKVLVRITAPLAKPAFLAAALLTIVRAVESFDAAAILGIPGNIWVFTSTIWRELAAIPLNLGAVGGYAGMLLIVAATGVLLHNWYARRGGIESVQTVSGKAYQARLRPIRGRARVLANTFVVVYVLAVIGLPLASLIYSSLLPFNMAPSAEAFEQMTLNNYRFVIGFPLIGRSARNSLILAVGAATVVMVLGSIAAWIVVRTKTRGRGILDNVAFLPIAYPGMVLGVSLLFLYLRVPLPIYGTLLILLIAYSTNYLPYGIRYASASMYQVHAELEEAAQVSGASWWQTFRRVMIPLIAPGFVAGWIYVAMLAARELSSSIILYSAGSEVISIAMFRLYFEGRTNAFAALGVMLILALMTLATIAYVIGRRFGVRQTAT